MAKIFVNRNGEYSQQRPFGELEMVRHADGGQPTDQRSRSWERVEATGGPLRER